MEITSILLGAAGLGLGLLAVAWGYYWVYSRRINRALNGKRRKRPLVPPFVVGLALLLVFGVGTACIVLSQDGGLRTAEDVIDAMAEKGGEEADWQVEFAQGEGMAAALAYGEEDSSFAVYRYDGSFRFRYGGGRSSSIEKGLRVFELGGEQALLSRNAPGIARIESHGGESYAVNPDQPFVLVIPSGGFTLYDSEGEPIHLDYERTTIQ